MDKKFKVMQSSDSSADVAIWYAGGEIKPQDINEAVYAVLCEAGQDILKRSVCRLSGEHTAVELAGKAGGMPVFDVPETMAPRVRVNVGMVSVGYKQQAPMFTCSFAPDDVFGTIAEWEGQMNMAPKNYHKFKCEAKEELKLETKPYARHRGYHPKTISLVMYHKQLNDKFETLGQLYQALSADGMRRALSVTEAARMFDNMSYGWRQIAKDAMLWKLWRDYGNCERLCRREEWLNGEMFRMRRDDQYGDRYRAMEKELADIRSKKTALSRPVPFSQQDLMFGPECYRKVDDAYVRELVDHVKRMAAEAPKPERPVRGDVVTIKDGARTLKKHEGKHLVDSVVACLSKYGDTILWKVAVSVGKYDTEYFLPEQLEPADEKPMKKSPKPKPKAKAKVVEHQTSSVNRHPSELSLSERLRQALLARLAA